MNPSRHPRLRFLGAGVAACFLLAGGAGAFADSSSWRMVATPRFTIVSEQGAGATADWAAEFEDFLDSLPQVIRVDERHLPPLTIVLLSKETEAQSYITPPPGQYYWHAQSFEFDGELLGRTVIVVGSANHSSGARFLAQQGLVQWYLNALPYWRPFAVNLGAAEVLSSGRHLQNHWRFGQDDRNFRSLLRQEPLTPVARLLAVKSDDEFTSDSDRVLFRAECWAFAHYLIFGHGPAERHAFGEFWLGLKQGLSPHGALAQALGAADADRIDVSLRAYVDQGTMYEQELPLDERAASSESVVPARPEAAEAALALASLAYHPDWAQEHADAAVRLAPGASDGFEMRAYELYFRDQPPAALRLACESALARGSGDPGTVFLEAYARFEGAGGGLAVSPDEARAVANLAETAINRNLALEPAFDLLARSLFPANRLTSSDHLFLDYGRRRFPDDWLITFGEAELARKQGDRSTARDLAQTAIAQAIGASPGDVATARSYAQIIDR